MAVSVRRRLTASLIDLAVIGGWLGVLPVSGAVVRRVVPARPTKQATLGKRSQGLRVVDREGAPPEPTRIALRTSVKLLPWQLAHVAVGRIMLGVREPWVVWPC